jgi:hypothetical protein
MAIFIRGSLKTTSPMAEDYINSKTAHITMVSFARGSSMGRAR